MEEEPFAWVRQASAVIDPRHPDWQYWQETFDYEEALAERGENASIDLPKPPEQVEIPAVALAVSRKQAAALLSISADHFERHILPDLRVIQAGRRQLIPVRELEAWVQTNMARALR